MVKIIRVRSTIAGTEGVLSTGDGFKCFTFELPWRNNERNVSCIPMGLYNVETRQSSKFGFTYWVKNVKDRSLILIHSGNYAGDVTKGLKTHVNGCILLGTAFGYLAGQRAILNSRIAVRRFMNHMENKPFVLEIRQ